jgi:flagellar motor switch protein FliN/FliY
MWTRGARTQNGLERIANEIPPISLSFFWPPFCMNSHVMATAHPLPAPSSEQHIEHPSEPRPVSDGEQALIPSSPQPEEDDPIELRPPLGRLPVELDVAIPVKEFRVRNLLALEPGQVIETQWAHGEDLPLAAGDVQLAWSEFEVVDAQLAVRVTRLA